MKKTIYAIIFMLTTAVSAKAMSYEQAKERALFLTDKMAYELDLTEEQYEAAYEINLDYLMGVTTADECFGTYWTQRNLDLSYVFLDWQYRSFCSIDYFYRPLFWDAGVWHFSVYSYYPTRTFFYFGRPGFVVTYYGGHSWRVNGGRSWYHGRSWVHHGGMRGGYDRGGYRNMSHGWRPGDGGNRGIHHGNGVTTNGRRDRGYGSSNDGSSGNRGNHGSYSGGNRDHGNGVSTGGSRREHGNGVTTGGSRREHGSTSGSTTEGSRPYSRPNGGISSHESSTRSTVRNSGERVQRDYTPQRNFSGTSARPSGSVRSSGSFSGSHSSGSFSGSHSSGSFSGGHSGGHSGGFSGGHGSRGGGGRSTGRR